MNNSNFDDGKDWLDKVREEQSKGITVNIIVGIIALTVIALLWVIGIFDILTICPNC